MVAALSFLNSLAYIPLYPGSKILSDYFFLIGAFHDFVIDWRIPKVFQKIEKKEAIDGIVSHSVSSLNKSLQAIGHCSLYYNTLL